MERNYGAICPWCGDIFAYFSYMPEADKPLVLGGVELPDGTAPLEGNLMVCQHCKKQIFRLVTTGIIKLGNVDAKE